MTTTCVTYVMCVLTECLQKIEKALKILTPTFVALLVETPGIQKECVGVLIFVHSG